MQVQKCLNFIKHFKNKECIGVFRTLQISKMESFATIVHDLQSLITVSKLSILDVCGDPRYTTVPHRINHNSPNLNLVDLVLNNFRKKCD